MLSHLNALYLYDFSDNIPKPEQLFLFLLFVSWEECIVCITFRDRTFTRLNDLYISISIWGIKNWMVINYSKLCTFTAPAYAHGAFDVKIYVYRSYTRYKKWDRAVSSQLWVEMNTEAFNLRIILFDSRN